MAQCIDTETEDRILGHLADYAFLLERELRARETGDGPLEEALRGTLEDVRLLLETLQDAAR